MEASGNFGDGNFQPGPVDLLRNPEVHAMSANKGIMASEKGCFSSSNYLKSLLKCLVSLQCDPEELLDETDRNNLSAGDYIVTAVSNGKRHTFLTQQGFQLANSE